MCPYWINCGAGIINNYRTQNIKDVKKWTDIFCNSKKKFCQCYHYKLRRDGKLVESNFEHGKTN